MAGQLASTLELPLHTELASTHWEYRYFDSLLEIHTEIFLNEITWSLGFPSRAQGVGRQVMGGNVQTEQDATLYETSEDRRWTYEDSLYKSLYFVNVYNFHNKV